MHPCAGGGLDTDKGRRYFYYTKYLYETQPGVTAETLQRPIVDRGGAAVGFVQVDLSEL